jgi:hypothetical protein
LYQNFQLHHCFPKFLKFPSFPVHHCFPKFLMNLHYLFQNFQTSQHCLMFPWTLSFLLLLWLLNFQTSQHYLFQNFPMTLLTLRFHCCHFLRLRPNFHLFQQSPTNHHYQ